MEPNNIEERYKNNYEKKSIIIIGSGPCGILSVRHLKDNNNANILCIDAKHDIGGLWQPDQYTEQNHPNLEKDSFYHDISVLPSSLYSNLITNLPKFLMSYKGYPPKQEYNEFMTSEQFIEYLSDYSNHHNLKQHILFNTYVQSVRLTQNLTEQEKLSIPFCITKKFLIQLSSSIDYTSNVRFLQADSVLVANGHNSKPNYPTIEDENKFEGNMKHMHIFREETMKEYINKHLVIYGCSMSSQDVVAILLKRKQLHEQPSKITVIGNPQFIQLLAKADSYKQEIKSSKLVFIPGYIQKFDSGNSLILKSGQKIENIDCFLYTTGYQYSIPFLEKNLQIDNLIEFYNDQERKNSLGPLYKRMFSIREPHLIFLGYLSNTVGIQQGYERQVITASKFVTGQIQLPSQQEMQDEFDKEMEVAKMTYPDGRDYFKVSFFTGVNEIQYFSELSSLSKIPMDNEFNSYIIDHVLPVYKDIFLNGNYPILKDQKFSHKIPQNYSPKLDLF